MRLSQRQREVCELIAQGLPNKRIAFALGLSVNSVRTHALAAYKKLGVKNRTAAAMAYRNSQ